MNIILSKVAISPEFKIISWTKHSLQEMEQPYALYACTRIVTMEGCIYKSTGIMGYRIYL